MHSMMVPIGGALALVGVVVLALKETNKRARNSLVALVVTGVSLAGWGYLRTLREDDKDHRALLKERKHLCDGVASSIAYHQDRFLQSASKPAWADQRAALSALEHEVSATWRMCVGDTSKCGSMKPSEVVEGSGDQLDRVRECFEEGPTPLESARSLMKD